MVKAGPKLSEAAVAAWRRAEATIGDRQACQRAARELPRRQALILLAMDALQRGSTDCLLEVREEAWREGAADLGVLLDLLLEDEPEALDPSRVRMLAKRRGVENAPLPRLDLLRLFACRLAEEPAQRSPALAKAARRSPLLDQLCPLLLRQHSLRWFAEPTRELSPRFLALLRVLIQRECGRPDPVGTAQREVPEAGLRLPPEEWPDLERPTRAARLVKWLHGEDLPRWREELARDLPQLLVEPAEVRGGFVRGLLTRAQVRLLAGRAAEATEVIDAARWILHRSQSTPELALLDRHLEREMAKLRALGPACHVPREVLVHLWQRARAASPAERAAAATLILEQSEPHRGSEVREALGVQLAREGLDESERIELLCHFGAYLEPRELEELLPAELPPALRSLYRGVHHVAQGRPVAAIEQSVRLLRDPASADAGARLLRFVLYQVDVAEWGKPMRRALDELVRAAAQTELPCTTLLEVTSALQEAFDFTRLGSRMSHLLPAVQRAIAPAREPQDGQLAAALMLAGVYRAQDRGRELFRELGRGLRGLAPAVADFTALRVLAHWYGEAPHAAALPAPMPQWIESLTGFVFRDGEKELVARLGDRLRSWPPRQREALSRWASDHRRRLCDVGFWYQLYDPLGLGLIDADLDLLDPDLF